MYLPRPLGRPPPTHHTPGVFMDAEYHFSWCEGEVEGRYYLIGVFVLVLRQSESPGGRPTQALGRHWSPSSFPAILKPPTHPSSSISLLFLPLPPLSTSLLVLYIKILKHLTFLINVITNTNFVIYFITQSFSYNPEMAYRHVTYFYIILTLYYTSLKWTTVS